ncbi:NIPSNAP family protein [Verrucomicrobiales bacterium]|nr:NIPSNAP family protein [Verrucomicrobiales bacterium]
MKLSDLVIILLGAFFCLLGMGGALAEESWNQSYSAGYIDKQGSFAGGSEIMHLVPHKGKVYAANGYWMDSRWVIPPEGQRQSAQVLRLDSTDSSWQVDLDMGKSNGHGLEYMKGNVLRSVTFTRDRGGKVLAEPVNLLVMAAGSNFERGGAVSAWVRNDESGTWTHSLVRHGSSVGGIRWVPRDMEIHTDKVTGVEKIFMSLGNPGIVAGTYDASRPEKIRWDRNLEFPFLKEGSFRTRPLGITVANGILFFSEGGTIYRRVDGKSPSYSKVLDFHEDTDTDVGGIRGLTTIKNPNGPGQSLLFLWAPGDRSECQVKRMDPDGAGQYTVHDEVKLIDLMSATLGTEVTYTLGAHNMMYPIIDKDAGETVHLIGFQGNIRTKKNLRWKGSALYAGALYAVRQEDQTYKVLEVNNSYMPGKRPLISPRAFCYSPFNDANLFIGGHDSSRKVSDNMAWVFKATLDVALGKRKGTDAKVSEQSLKPDPHLLSGPVYELRIYSANEGRFSNLIQRFREHTDTIFKKHGLEPIGYWTPNEGPAKKRRRFIYILKHESRYAAYRNWVNFSNDKDWERALDQPKFQNLLALKPVSIFLEATDYLKIVQNDIKEPGGIYELRTYVAKPGKLGLLNDRFSEHTAAIFNRHRIKNLFYWTAFDQPESKNTLIYLLHHASRKQADLSWKAFGGDPEWRKVAKESQINGTFLAQPPERIYLKPTDFSPLK